MGLPSQSSILNAQKQLPQQDDARRSRLHNWHHFRARKARIAHSRPAGSAGYRQRKIFKARKNGIISHPSRIETGSIIWLRVNPWSMLLRSESIAAVSGRARTNGWMTAGKGGGGEEDSGKNPHREHYQIH